ncbi:MotA/TolQ/ExbB proton channel family protein [Primorskyibacter flagellatus]|uniref:MotA/TolQ/ExbB proton channel family protein n=1 Tax=Primorskyibacter flagellatus TaxID=1387277 RepID=UPI003A8D68D2
MKFNISDRVEQFLLYGVLPFVALFLAFWLGPGLLPVLLVFACPVIAWLVPRKQWLAPDLGLGALPVVGLIALSLLTGSAVYRYLQDSTQARLYSATAEVDVLADLCARTPGLVQSDCEGPALDVVQGSAQGSERGQLSWLTIWSLLRETNQLDERNFPNPGALLEADRTDKATAMIIDFLRAKERMEETSFGLLQSLTRPCGIAGQSDGEDKDVVRAHDVALEMAIAFTLADLQDRTLDISHRALSSRADREHLAGLTDLRLYEFSRSDLEKLRNETNNFFRFRDLYRKEMPQPYRDEELLTALLLSGAAYSGDQIAAANSFLDLRKSEDNGSTIGSYVRLTEESDEFENLCAAILNKSEKPGQGSITQVSTSAAATPDRFDLDDPAQLFKVLKMREEIALYVAGRIRTADATRDERFWLTLVTGYEQFSMIVLFVLGLLFALFRFVSLGLAYFKREIWFAADGTSVSSLLFGLRSSRWPLRLIAAILPAIGFVGTVRGIMLSLTGADQIVWATTINERSAAISALATDLGLAFATTLIALVLGIVLSLVAGAEQRLSEVTVLRV